MTADRHVILHYHLFKNAGTSLDAVLKRAFPDEWVTAEFPLKGGSSTALLAEWIAATPKAKVFSTHTGLGQVPSVPGVQVFPVIFLREPIARIRSAYRFERKQNADTFGSKLAGQTDLEGYVRARLARGRDRQCRNFQTFRFAGFAPGAPGEFELERALRALRTLPFVGIVERFEDSIKRLAEALPPELSLPDVGTAHSNRTEADGEALDGDLRDLLEGTNRQDAALYALAREAFDAAGQAPVPRGQAPASKSHPTPA